MARSVDLLTLRNRMLQRANLENSRLISTQEATDYVNQSWAYIYEIIARTGEDYYTVSKAYATTTNVATYAVPDDFYKETGLDFNINGVIIDARRFMFSERNLYQSPSIWTSGAPVGFSIIGSNLTLYPTPVGVYPFTLWYIQTPGLLQQDQDAIDGIAGYEEAVVLCGAVKCRQKESIAAPDLIRARDDELLRIQSMAQSRIAGEPARINRTRHMRECGSWWRPRWI